MTAGPAGGFPAKGTPEREVWRAATEVAIRAPEKHGPTTYSAQVPWWCIEELRAALEAVGIDWRAAKRKQDARRPHAGRGPGQEVR